MIQSRAKLAANQLGIADFNASNGWFTRWLWRFNIGKSVKLHGEAADIDLVEAESKMSVILENWLMPDTKQKTFLTWTKLVYTIVACPIVVTYSRLETNGRLGVELRR